MHHKKKRRNNGGFGGREEKEWRKVRTSKAANRQKERGKKGDKVEITTM